MGRSSRSFFTPLERVIGNDNVAPAWRTSPYPQDTADSHIIRSSPNVIPFRNLVESTFHLLLYVVDEKLTFNFFTIHDSFYFPHQRNDRIYFVTLYAEVYFSHFFTVTELQRITLNRTRSR